MGRCGDCKHWIPEGGEQMEAPDGYGHCEEISDNFHQVHRVGEKPKPLAFTAFDYDLFTLADFGCELFKPKLEG